MVWFKRQSAAPVIHSLFMAGAAYVNIFYLLRTEARFPEADRQLCINLTQLSITLGILSGTLLELLTIQLESYKHHDSTSACSSSYYDCNK